MTRDINKLIMEVVKAINLIFISETPLSLFTNITNTPIMGIKSNDDNNMDKKRKTIPLVRV